MYKDRDTCMYTKEINDNLNKEYLINLCLGFKAEIHLFENRIDCNHLKESIETLHAKCARLGSVIHHDEWDACFKEYINLNRMKALLLNDKSNPARIYDNMNEFWQDAKEQACASSPYTFWDTYEHGRRRQLEQLLANYYGSQSAILVNSGMSAIAIALEAIPLRMGDVVITTEKNYFETSDYLDNFLKLRGVHVLRVKEGDLKFAIKKYKPKIVLVETVGNYPETSLIDNWQEWLDEFPEITFIIDNTVQSHLTKWYLPPFNAGKNVVIVESAIKYITEECVAGVIYGWTETLERMRHYARAVGNFLQEKCFNYLSEGMIKSMNIRMQLHSRNTKLLSSVIKNESNGCLEYCRTLDNNLGSSEIFNAGVGCLIYCKPVNDSKLSQAAYNRLVLSKWQEISRPFGLKVRAGFGWHETFTRVYEGGDLNQASAPDYIRIAVGLENTQRILELSHGFIEALECVRENNNDK